mgnify:CR=1 FL=1
MHSAAFVAIGLLLVACEPVGPLAGHTLAGEPTPPPADWTSVAGAETVQLQTRQDDPYSVNIWGVAIGPDFYVASARGANASWVGHIASSPDVKLRIGKALYDLRAVRVSDTGELARVSAAYAAKYKMDDEDKPKEPWVYRLDRRTTASATPAASP